jgi:YjbE family integral membrane protein
MDFGDVSTWLLIPLQILFVDLLLGADNALVIALACRSLPPEDMRRAASLGVAGAIAMRIAMTTLATSLLTLPFIKLIGGLALVMIAMSICADDEDGPARPRAVTDLWSAAAIIVVADAAMSLDNVVALAAITRGNFWLLAIGVALSLPLIAYGGIILSQWLAHAPTLVTFGAAMLGWIAGDMALSDPILAPWAEANAPGLVAIAPALGAAFVYLYGRIAQREAPASAAARQPPAPLPRPAQPRQRSAPQARLAPFGDRSPEPMSRVEPPHVPATREDRVAIIGVLLLAVAAGAILMIVSLIDSYN